MQDTVRLYTRQNEKTLAELERTGRLLNRKIYVRLHFGPCWEIFMDAYEWFTETASEIIPKPDDAELPIWCTVNPDTCLKAIPGTLVYVLDVPKDHIIYFDEARWDYVLNYHYVAENEADERDYRKHLDAIGVSDGFQFFHGKYKGFYPEEVERIRESWKRVFSVDTESCPFLCANLWEIKKEWIVRVVRPGEPLTE